MKMRVVATLLLAVMMVLAMGMGLGPALLPDVAHAAIDSKACMGQVRVMVDSGEISEREADALYSSCRRRYG